MASIYQRARSPFYWIKYKTAKGLRYESTGLRTDNSTDKRRAEALRLQKSIDELALKPDRKSDGWDWVLPFLQTRYQSSQLSLARYRQAWTNLRRFLDERKILSPGQLTRKHCFEFVAWRAQPDPAAGKYRAGMNTTLLEIKTLRIVSQEAVEREMITGNPCVKLGLKPARANVKPELSAAHCAAIRAAIPSVENENERSMLARSFEIARHQGCRVSETRLNPLAAVHFNDDGNTITFNAKGNREITTALHPKLVPLFKRLHREKCVETWAPPAHYKYPTQWCGNVWHKFLKRLKIGHGFDGVTFHSTRVTVVTEMARANVPENKAQRYVGHASTTVHRIYQRLRHEDVAGATDAIG